MEMYFTYCGFVNFGIETAYNVVIYIKVVNGPNGHVMPYLMENVY